jgi:hypothetical protein
MVDCALTNEAILFWLFSVAISIILGWLARDREIRNLKIRIKNFEKVMTALRDWKLGKHINVAEPDFDFSSGDL